MIMEKNGWRGLVTLDNTSPIGFSRTHVQMLCQKAHASVMACVSRHDILSCEFCLMNWDFDRAVTGSLSKLSGYKVTPIL